MASIKANISKKTGEIASYRLRADLGLDESGKRRIQTKTIPVPSGLTPAKAQKAAQMEADKWEQELKNGLAPIGKRTFSCFVLHDFFEIHGSELKPSTFSFYKSMSKRPLEYFGKRELASITSLDIERYLLHLKNDVKQDRNGEPLSPKTIKHEFAFLRTVFAFAEQHDLLTKNPMKKVDCPKVPTKRPDILDEKQAQDFLAALGDAPLRWRAAMITLLILGLRRGELCGLQWKDIDFANEAISIRQNVVYVAGKGITISTPKTALSLRTLPLSHSLAALLRKWKQEQAAPYGGTLLPDAFVFGVVKHPYDPPTPDSVTQWLARFTAKQGLPNVSPHDLRHSCASLLLMSGATVKDCQEFMGHSDPSTTMKYYISTTEERLRKAGDGLAAALNF